MASQSRQQLGALVLPQLADARTLQRREAAGGFHPTLSWLAAGTLPNHHAGSSRWPDWQLAAPPCSTRGRGRDPPIANHWASCLTHNSAHRNKHLSRLQPNQLVGRYARIRAADPVRREVNVAGRCGCKGVGRA